MQFYYLHVWVATHACGNYIYHVINQMWVGLAVPYHHEALPETHTA